MSLKFSSLPQSRSKQCHCHTSRFSCIIQVLFLQAALVPLAHTVKCVKESELESFGTTCGREETQASTETGALRLLWSLSYFKHRAPVDVKNLLQLGKCCLMENISKNMKYRSAFLSHQFSNLLFYLPAQDSSPKCLKWQKKSLRQCRNLAGWSVDDAGFLLPQFSLPINFQMPDPMVGVKSCFTQSHNKRCPLPSIAIFLLKGIKNFHCEQEGKAMCLLNIICFSWKAFRYYRGKSADDEYFKVTMLLKMHSCRFSHVCHPCDVLFFTIAAGLYLFCNIYNSCVLI